MSTERYAPSVETEELHEDAYIGTYQEVSFDADYYGPWMVDDEVDPTEDEYGELVEGWETADLDVKES